MSKYQALEDALKQDFGYDSPIILNEINSDEKYDLDKNSFRKYLSRLHREEKIQRYDNGIYYFASKNKYFNDWSKLSEEKVIENRFVSYLGETFGYFTGYKFANQLSLTVQVPQVIEVATDNISKKKIEKNYIIRKARTEVTEENYKLLQVFDLFTDYESLIEKPSKEVKKRVLGYLKDVEIDRRQLISILKEYPAKTTQKLYFDGYLDYLTSKGEEHVSLPR